MSKLVFTNFLGSLTRFPTGAPDSGKCVDRTSYGYHPWTEPGSITFNDKQTDITGIVTGVIIDGKPRVENGILYIYMIDHEGKFYKSQVNDSSTKNILFDSISLIGQLSTAVSFTMGGTMEFHAGRVYIGHDQGVTSVEFDGSDEKFVGDKVQWEQNVPRQGKIFFSVLYFTNGSNVAAINNVGEVITYRTITDVPDEQIFKTVETDATGTLLNLISSNVPNTSLITTEPNLRAAYIATSYIFKWDPKKNKVMSIKRMAFDQTAALTVGNNEFIWGYDVPGGSFVDISNGIEKITSGTGTYLIAQSPTANAVERSGNLVGWVTVEPKPTASIANFQGASVFLYGNLDRDEPTQIYGRLISFLSSLTGGDIIRVPWVTLIGNLQTTGFTSGYGSGLTINQTGTGRIYLSTVEFDGVNTAYKLYSFSVINPFLNPCDGVYETQAVLAGTEGTTASDFTPSSVRVYMEPALGAEQFTIDLIGIDGNPVTNDSGFFTVSAFDATGSITLSDQPADSNTITIDDGSGAKVFEFDDDASVTGANIAVTIGATIDLTLGALVTSINSNLGMSASTDGISLVSLSNLTGGVIGNIAITKIGGNIAVTGMSGGIDANISAGDTVLTYTPSGAATAALGVRVTNSGSFTPIIHKIEVDY